MADLDDVDPRDITIPSDDPNAADVPDANPDAAAEEDEDNRVGDESEGNLSDNDPNKSW